MVLHIRYQHTLPPKVESSLDDTIAKMLSELLKLDREALKALGPDTCMYIEALSLIEDLYADVKAGKCKRVVIVNTKIVLRELEKHKNSEGNSVVAAQAKAALEFIETCVESGDGIMHNLTNSTGSGRRPASAVGAQGTRSNDARIVKELIYDAREQARMTIIVTLDRGMHVEARRQMLRSIYLEVKERSNASRQQKNGIRLSRIIESFIPDKPESLQKPEQLLMLRQEKWSHAEVAQSRLMLYITACELLQLYVEQKIPCAGSHNRLPEELLWAEIIAYLRGSHAALQNRLPHKLLTVDRTLQYNEDERMACAEKIILCLSQNSHRASQLLRLCGNPPE